MTQFSRIEKVALCSSLSTGLFCFPLEDAASLAHVLKEEGGRGAYRLRWAVRSTHLPPKCNRLHDHGYLDPRRCSQSPCLNGVNAWRPESDPTHNARAPRYAKQCTHARTHAGLAVGPAPRSLRRNDPSLTVSRWKRGIPLRGKNCTT